MLTKKTISFFELFPNHVWVIDHFNFQESELLFISSTKILHQDKFSLAKISREAAISTLSFRIKIIEGFHYLVSEESKLFKLFTVWYQLCKGHFFFFFFFEGRSIIEDFYFCNTSIRNY